MIADTLLRGKKLFGIHHPSRRTVIRLFVQQNGDVIDVTVEVAKAIKCKVVKQRWMEIPGKGQNPVFAAAVLYAKSIGKEMYPFRDLH